MLSDDKKLYWVRKGFDDGINEERWDGCSKNYIPPFLHPNILSDECYIKISMYKYSDL